MKPLIILLSSYAIALIATKFFRKNFQFALSGKIAMSAMLLFTAVAHFAFARGMSMMLPDFVPHKALIVYSTGVMEIAFAVFLLVPQFGAITGWLLIVFFILILPANVYAAINNVDYQHATFDGNGVTYLWFRVPLQIVFIVWTYLSAIKYGSR